MKNYDIDSLENRDSELIERLIRYLGPILEAAFRPIIRGFEHIPDGAGLYVGNHNAALLSPDVFAFCVRLAEERGIDARMWA